MIHKDNYEDILRGISSSQYILQRYIIAILILTSFAWATFDLTKYRKIKNDMGTLVFLKK